MSLERHGSSPGRRRDGVECAQWTPRLNRKCLLLPATWPPRTVIRKSSGLRTLESALYRGGLGPVAGVDEVGRGACAGPLVVAACVLRPADAAGLEGATDSKLLTAARRGHWH